MAKHKIISKKVKDPEDIRINGIKPKKLTKKVQVPKSVFTEAVLAKREELEKNN